MNQVIADPEVQILAGLAATIAPDYAPAINDPWLGSPFQWILAVPSRTKGAIGESLVSGWCAAKGFDVDSLAYEPGGSHRSWTSDRDQILYSLEEWQIQVSADTRSRL